MWEIKCIICNVKFEAQSGEVTCPTCGQEYDLLNDYQIKLTSEQLNLLRLDFIHNRQKAADNG
jgi:uncharacterized Zn finger protein (UPF0148 family)